MINKYPYTDFHELNLDWFLAEFKKVMDGWAEMQASNAQFTEDMTANFNTLDATVTSFINFVNSYFDNLDVQQEINNKLDAMVEDGTLKDLLQPYFNELVINVNNKLNAQDADIDVLSARVDAIVALPSGSTQGDAELMDIRVGYNGETFSTAGAAVRGQISNVHDEINEILNTYHTLSEYIYKEDIYFDANGNETSLPGYTTYKIPVNTDDIVRLKWDSDTAPYYQLAQANVAKIWKTDDSFEVISNDADGILNPTTKEILIHARTDVLYLTVTFYKEYQDDVHVQINRPYDIMNDLGQVNVENTVYQITEKTAIRSTLFFANNSTSSLGSGYYALILKIKQGDVITFGSKISGISYRAMFVDASGAGTQVGSAAGSKYVYTAAADGIISIFHYGIDTDIPVLNPKDQISIDFDNIVNAPEAMVNPWDQKNGVAFGTSLTYRSQTTGGYLNYLPTLSGITFDNQGVGSAGILYNDHIYENIMNYDSYADKDVCIIEGFVNDWYYNASRGNYTDTESTTVCGRLRACIQHILTQNPDITIFLVLDHYGNDITASTVVRSGNTQFTYYEEIAKVAESLGIPVIKEYAESRINEFTPQFLIDNIHPNATGAEQSAHVIWDHMKNTYPNVVS